MVGILIFCFGNVVVVFEFRFDSLRIYSFCRKFLVWEGFIVVEMMIRGFRLGFFFLERVEIYLWLDLLFVDFVVILL